MRWSVNEDFCSDGVSYSSFAPRTYHIYPKLNIETSRELTEEERRRVIDALVTAAATGLWSAWRRPSWKAR